MSGYTVRTINHPVLIELQLVGLFSDVVSRWIVAADDVSGIIASASHRSAADACGGRPHHLRVVEAFLVTHARIGAVVVVLLLAHPIVHGILRRPSGPAGSPEQILSIRTPRVHQVASRALAGLRLRVIKSVILQGGVPNNGVDAHRASCAVVGVQVSPLIGWCRMPIADVIIISQQQECKRDDNDDSLCHGSGNIVRQLTPHFCRSVQINASRPDKIKPINNHIPSQSQTPGVGGNSPPLD